MKQKTLFAFITISLLLLLLDSRGFLAGLKDPIEKGIVPVKKTLFQGIYHLRFFPDIFVSYSKLVEERKEIKNIRKEQEELKLKLQVLTQENQDLRRQLGAFLPTSFRYTPAPIIGFSRYLEIGAGNLNNIKIGMPVVDGDVFIGRIIKVSPSRSSVILVTDKDMNVSAKTNRGTPGEITGQFGKSILFDKVLQKDPLFLDDLVVTSGQDGLPPNLLIGKISHIVTDDVAVYKQAKIEPLVKINDKQNVLVITSL